MASEPKGNNKIDLGPSGEAVAGNLAELRQRLQLSYAALEKRTTDNGRRIPAISLRRIEDRNRRVDVDELVALSYALETTPAELLDGGVRSGLTGVPIEYTWHEASAWIRGEIDDFSGYNLLRYWEEQARRAQNEIDAAKSLQARADEGFRPNNAVDWGEYIARREDRLTFANNMADLRAATHD